MPAHVSSDEFVHSPGPGMTAQLPVTKLPGLSPFTRAALRAARITRCDQLLDAAADDERRRSLQRRTGLDLDTLVDLARRADMMRLHGVGSVFAMMLAELDVRDVSTVAMQDPVDLHHRLCALNQRLRVSRRSPTPDEVRDWVAQANGLPVILKV